jgi:hypothetical protein
MHYILQTGSIQTYKIKKIPLNLCQHIFINYLGGAFIDKTDYVYVYNIMLREPEIEHYELKLDSKLMIEGNI